MDMLLHVRTGNDGRPLPEVLYGRRKMTAWLARNGGLSTCWCGRAKAQRADPAPDVFHGRSAC